MTEAKKGGRRLTDKEFNESVQDTRLTPTSIEVAHLVLVTGVTQVEAAQMHGLTEPRVSKIVNTVWNAHKARSTSLANDHESKAALVQADFDVMVMELRKAFGDDIQIRRADPVGQFTGTIVHRTDFFAVQDVGKQAMVIHRLSQLDVSPRVDSKATIIYSGSQGKVQVRDDKGHGSSVDR